MRPVSSVFCDACRACFAAVLLYIVLGAVAHAAVVSLDSGELLISPAVTPPDRMAAWQQVVLPDEWRHQRGISDGTTLWYRFELIWPAGSADRPTALYVPYLNNGGTWLLNGLVLARLPSTDADYIVRWVRPHFISIPDGLLRPGRNTLLLRTVVREFGAAQQLPKLAVGDESQLRPKYGQRLFLVYTVPLITVAATGLLACLLLLIWWRRQQELLHGLLGLTMLLWGVRTLTLVMELLPLHIWPLWRVIYHGATGGFVVAIALFVLRFSGSQSRWQVRALCLYWAIGPVTLICNVALEHPLISGYWSLGLLLISCGTLAITLRMALQQRSWQTILQCAVLSLTWLAGLHDLLVDRNDSWILSVAPGWVAQQIFLLHHAANLLLLVLTGILTTRFVQTLDTVDQLNATLQQRVMERERELMKSYAELSRLNRERAIEEERARLVRDMHDGLGSQLFTSLARVQRTAVSQEEMQNMLHASISEMRLAMDALAPSDDDFQAVLGNFRYRWESELLAAGIESSWRIDELKLPPHQRLHVLRILQEALTNVLKHAGATKVSIEAVHDSNSCRFEVNDNGKEQAVQAPRSGRGIHNMRARAMNIGATFDIEHSITGTLVKLLVPRAFS